MKMFQLKLVFLGLLFTGTVNAQENISIPTLEGSLYDPISSIANIIVTILILAALPGLVLPLIEYFKLALKKCAYKIVLLRHGESVWNSENRFTGWTDVDLSDLGTREAEEAGQTLKKEGYVFDLVFTSVLKRAIRTTDIVLEQMGLAGIGTKYAWQLNERHYGGLQGLNKAEMARKYGEEQVHIWRRSYEVRPAAMDDAIFEKQNAQEIFKTVPPGNMPRTESLSDTYERAVGYWISDIAPAIKKGKKIMVSAHGNSLRAIVKYLDGISDEKISKLNIPTGVPLVYELNERLEPIKHYYLGDQKEILRKIAAVKNQCKK